MFSYKLLRLRVLVHFDNPIQTPPLTCIKVGGVLMMIIMVMVMVMPLMQ